MSVELFPRDFQGARCQVQDFLPLLALTLLFSDSPYCYTIPHPEAQWPAWQPGMGKETVSSGVPACTLAIPGDSAHTEETWVCLSLPRISQLFIWWICSKWGKTSGVMNIHFLQNCHLTILLHLLLTKSSLTH